MADLAAPAEDLRRRPLSASGGVPRGPRHRGPGRTGPLATLRRAVSRRRAGPSLDVAGLCDRLAALLRAGLPAGAAWRHLAQAAPSDEVLAAVAAAVAEGESAGVALEAAARRAGDLPEAVGWLAVCLLVVERSGAPAADVLDRFAASLRADAAAREDVEAALAGPRATAGVLTVLPVAGLALSALAGADPTVLVRTAPGLVCLVLGSAAWAAGRWWASRLVAAAERA